MGIILSIPQVDGDTKDVDATTSIGSLFQLTVKGLGGRFADSDLKAETGDNNELAGSRKCFQFLGGVRAELVLAEVDVPVELPSAIL